MSNENYDVIIGLEIHIQSKTESKMFCSCSNNYFGKEPNTNVCPICLGLPGALPLPNKKAIENCIKLGLATNCTISNTLKFDRKHYFYPDLPKGYQISQYDMPLCFNGSYKIESDQNETEILIERIHQEEDVAKSFHNTDSSNRKYSAIDYNKSGVPLIELVTKPVIKSAKEAKDFATAIRQLVRWLGISDADMEKGQMRCEPNISVQRKGSWELNNGKVVALNGYTLNPKVEVKNIGSISAIEKAILFEVDRMINEIENGTVLKQQTRGWNPDMAQTVFQRSKESAPDYRYFPDPDIPLIKVGKEVVETIQSGLPVLPSSLRNMYREKFSLSNYDSNVLTSTIKTAQVFNTLVDILTKELDSQIAGKEASKWITGTLFSIANEQEKSLDDLKFDIKDLAKVIFKVQSGKILYSKAKEIVVKALKEEADLGNAIESVEEIVSDSSQIDLIIEKVITGNEKAVIDYRNGKEASIMFLVGQVMRESKGLINPNQAKEILIKKIQLK